jgi:hypothetical protein
MKDKKRVVMGNGNRTYESKQESSNQKSQEIYDKNKSGISIGVCIFAELSHMPCMSDV